MHSDSKFFQFIYSEMKGLMLNTNIWIILNSFLNKYVFVIFFKRFSLLEGMGDTYSTGYS